MLIYWFGLGLSMLLAWVGTYTTSYREGRKFYTIFFSGLPLTIISGIRYMCGTDYRVYVNYFSRYRHGEFISDIEPLYGGLNVLIGKLGGDYRHLIFITSAIFVYVAFLFIFNESENKVLSIYLLFTMGFYFAAFNGIRQLIACAIMAYSLKYVWEEDLKKFLICAIIAAGFHYTALIFILVFWLDKINVRLETALIVTALMEVFKRVVVFLINNITILTKYREYVGQDASNHFFALAIQLVLLVFASIAKSNDREYTIYYNLQILSTWALILSNAIYGFHRVQWMMNLPSIVFIPMILNRLSDKRIRFIAGVGIVACYGVYIYYTTVMLHKHDVLPYRTFI